MNFVSYHASGRAKSTKEPQPDLFKVRVNNHQLVKLAYEAELAQKRASSAHSKNRSAVAGGGRKPHPQKRTGRARAGSIRSPLWRTGGVIFGPTGQANYHLKVAKKAKRQALVQALVLSKPKLVLIDRLQASGKTAELARLLERLGLSRRILLVDEPVAGPLLRAAANLKQVQVRSARYLTVVAVLDADHIVFTPAALKATSDWLTTDQAKAT